MREIKFRAWDSFQRKMISFEELDIADQFKEIYFYMFIKGQYTYIKPLEYTGLKDINGVEIYEGDIVHIEGASGFISRSIKFERGTFHFGYIDDGMSDYREMRVVGNIYENPELLEG